MAEHFTISDRNPNDGIGGRGCLCNPQGDIDCQGPFALFHATETESNLSPYAVLGLGCAKAVVDAAKGEALAAGEDPEDRPLAVDDDLSI